jgi:hypothetical protein
MFILSVSVYRLKRVKNYNALPKIQNNQNIFPLFSFIDFTYVKIKNISLTGMLNAANFAENNIH